MVWIVYYQGGGAQMVADPWPADPPGLEQPAAKGAAGRDDDPDEPDDWEKYEKQRKKEAIVFELNRLNF